MKKSIFLFFAAILCAMTANAQWALMGTLTDWSSGKAMTVSGTTATCTVELPGKTTYTLKVKNSGTWYGRNSTTISATTTTGAFSTSGGDVTLNTDIPGTYTFSFNTSSRTLTVTYPTAPAPHDITVRAQVPASWTNTITAWVWTSENGDGEEVTPTKDGDYYVVTKNAGALYAIFKNGAGWNGDKNQTVDLCYTEDVCLQLNQSGTAKATATVIDCGAVSKDITVKAIVPGAWENTITAWVWPTGGEGKEVTPTKDGNWYVVTENCIELNVIFKNGTGWNGDENQTVNIEGVSENTCYQISALNKEGGKCSVTTVDCEAAIEPEAKPEPTPTYDYYVTGSFNGWNEKDPAHGMTLDGEFYKATITLATGENLVKVTNGTWTDAKGFSAMGAEYEEVSAGASDDNIMVTLAAGKDVVVVVYNATTKKVTFEGLTEKAPAPTFDYYICGSFNSNNPKNAENGMTLDGEVYKATVTLAEGDNTLKVTNGTWDQTWGANELGAAYEEVSNPNDYNNIKITLAAEKEITVIFDATAGKITFEGLTPYVAPLTYTVTVPAGTDKCYIAGPKNVWDFQEMTATANENEFTITITGAKETDEYKYACQANWDYAEVIEGGGNRTQWTALDNVTAWNKPAVITYQLKGVDGWDVAGIEMTENPDKAGEYKLTCQAISATDAVKVVKLADGVITDYYGDGTVKDGVEVTVNYDGDGNITLPEGTYDFYFDTNEAEKKLWIAAATGCAPATATITLEDAGDLEAILTLSADEYVVGDEITASAQIFDDGYAFAYWKEGENIVSYNADYTFTVEGDRTLEAYFGGNMPVEMADLVVDVDAMTITGSNTTDGVTASLKLDEYDSDMDLWSIDAANSAIGFDPFGSGTPITLNVLYGEVWLDMETQSTAMAKVVASFNEEELFVFNLDMTAATETLEVGVATELSLEFGALVMRGTWYDENDVEYPFEAQVGGFDYTKAEQECMTTVSLGNFDDDTNWLGMAQGLMTVTVADGTLELTGTVTTMWPVNTLNIVAQGMIEILDLNLDATVEETGGYLHLTAVDDEVSGMDFNLYLNDYTGVDGEYELNEMSTVAGGAAAATGSLTKSGNTYTGTVYAAAGTLYVFDLTLTEFVLTYDNINITGLSGAAEARYMGWGSEYYLALSLEGTWSDGTETYPVLLEITDGYDAAATSGIASASLTIGGWGDDDPWLGNAEGEISYTLSGQNITLNGKMESPWMGIYWDVTLTGTILPNYTRDVTAGNFGTLCLPFGGTVEGAELFECVGQETGKVYIASVTKLEAGVPYIFLANANQIAVYCDATVADEAGNNNGLHGTFDDNTVVEAGNYILLNNELRPSDGTAKVNANRAYLVMSGVPTEPVQQMPGRRYIGMSTQGENEATGLDNIATSENAVKVINNGQLIIIRGGEKFNAQGQKL